MRTCFSDVSRVKTPVLEHVEWCGCARTDIYCARTDIYCARTVIYCVRTDKYEYEY